MPQTQRLDVSFTGDPALEKTVLGAALVDAGAAELVCSTLTPEDFRASACSTTFAAAQDAWKEGGALDHRIVSRALKARGELKTVGGVLWITELLESALTANIEQHVQALRQDSARRVLLRKGYRALEMAQNPTADLADALSEWERAGEEATGKAAATPGKDGLRGPLGRVFDALTGAGKAELWKLSIPPLDNLLGGVCPGNLIIVAARPGGGKTTLAAQMSLDLAYQGRRPVMFSYEMGEDEMAKIFVSNRARVCIRKDGTCREDMLPRVLEINNDLADLPYIIDDTAPGLSQLVARMREYHRRKGANVFVVDYLQLVPFDQRADTREQEVASISRQLKRTARALNSVVICCAQLNRAFSGRPGLSNLRESGAIEQDADAVLFVHANDDEKNRLDWPVTLIVAKNRHGETGDVSLVWERGYRRFCEQMPDGGPCFTAPIRRDRNVPSDPIPGTIAPAAPPPADPPAEPNPEPEDHSDDLQVDDVLSPADPESQEEIPF